VTAADVTLQHLLIGECPCQVRDRISTRFVPASSVPLDARRGLQSSTCVSKCPIFAPLAGALGAWTPPSPLAGPPVVG